MAVRKQRSTTKAETIDTDINLVIKEAKAKYRNDTDEFYIFETYSGSGYYFAESDKLSENHIQHWKFNNKRWQQL